MYVRRATTAEEIDACLRIRRTVFIDEQGVPEEDELDALDQVCSHFMAFPWASSALSDIVGTVRLLPLDDGRAKVQRMAVLASHRNGGVGTALMFAVEGEAARGGRMQLILSSQLGAIAFYERLGWLAYGEAFMDAGIEHRMMKKNLR